MNTEQKDKKLDVSNIIGGEIARLWNTRDSSSTKASLSALRSSVNRKLTDAPPVWELILSLPGLSEGAKSDEPTFREVAAHLSLALYATQQQSRPQPQHVAGASLGSAIRKLTDAHGTSVQRRFAAILTAADISEVAYHLQSIVKQLRSYGIPLDYAQLSLDLALFQIPEQRSKVLYRWSRQYYSPTRTVTGTKVPQAESKRQTPEPAEQPIN